MTTIDGGEKIPEGATHLINVCDTFSYEDYIVFAFGDEDMKNKRQEYNKNMQRINNVIKLINRRDAKGRKHDG